MRRAQGAVAVLLCLGLVASACSGGDDDDPRDGTPAPPAATEPALDDCELLDGGACLLPYPNDAFTVAADTPTGRQLRLPAEGMPTAVSGAPVSSEDMDRGDGFSPGSAVLVHVPGLDLDATGLPDSTDIGASLAEDAPLVLLDVDTGERVAWWAELDAHAPADEALLMVQPAQALVEGHRYAVGLRDLRGADGEPVAPNAGWTEVVDGTFEPLLRREHLQAVEALLDEAAGDEDWWMAWDFTVASSESLSGRLRHIRDEAYEELGRDAPGFTVESVERMSADVRVVRGTFEVPLFLTAAGPGGRFTLDTDGLPERGEGVLDARFVCLVPVSADEPYQPIVYGHGLMGSAEEVESLAAAVPLGGLVPCATDWIGMSRADLPLVNQVLGDLSRFPALADRLQQGHLAMSFLGRLLNHPDGFARDAAFHDISGDPVFEVGATQFVGNSQGGILGGATSAVSTEWSRVVLGVPGMGYSLLLPRSIDWDPFAATFTAAYTDPTEQVLALQLIQLLWDRGENQGYAQHLTTDPYPGIEAKDVLLVEAFGDHQVANVATERLARTLGARAHVPALGEGRSPAVEPLWGIEPLGPDREGSALVLWDFGTPAPPVGNVAPRSPVHGEDPHGAGISEPRVLAQAFGFLRTGVTEDVCGGAPCTSTAS